METAGGTTNREEIRQKCKSHFPWKMVRKDLTKKIEEGANVVRVGTAIFGPRNY